MNLLELVLSFLKIEMGSDGWVLSSEGGVFLERGGGREREVSFAREEGEGEGRKGTNEKIRSKSGVDSAQELKSKKKGVDERSARELGWSGREGREEGNETRRERTV